MIKQVFFGALLLTVVFWTAGFRPFFDWFKFGPEDGSFSVLMPSQPTKQDENKDTSLGTIHSQIWLVKDQGAIYLAGITDYPVDVDPKKELVLDRINFLKAVNATFDKESEITLSGHPGLEFTGSSENYDFFSRVYMDGNRRVYQVVAGYPKGGDHNLSGKFLDSFEILKPVSK